VLKVSGSSRQVGEVLVIDEARAKPVGLPTSEEGRTFAPLPTYLKHKGMYVPYLGM